LNWTIKVSSTAEKYFNKLSRNTKTRIKKELSSLSILESPLDHQNVKPLIGDLRGFYRLKVGDYRVIFGMLQEDKIIAVVNISPRGDVCK